MNNQITMQHVSFQYETSRPILQDITFTVQHNESIGIVGANGVGKSTLLKLLVGLNMQYTGEIFVDGEKLEKKNLAQIRQKIGYVFQDSDNQLFMSTVYDDIAFGPRNYGYDPETVEQCVHDALNQVHIEHLKDRQIYKMSGGEKKLVSIATILAMKPDILLMDEPSITLDPKNRRNLIHLLNSFPQCKLIASHDLDMILDTCARTILMADGKIIADGKTTDILTNQKLLEENGLELPLSMLKHTW